MLGQLCMAEKGGVITVTKGTGLAVSRQSLACAKIRWQGEEILLWRSNLRTGGARCRWQVGLRADNPMTCQRVKSLGLCPRNREKPFKGWRVRKGGGWCWYTHISSVWRYLSWEWSIWRRTLSLDSTYPGFVSSPWSLSLGLQWDRNTF